VALKVAAAFHGFDHGDFVGIAIVVGILAAERTHMSGFAPEEFAREWIAAWNRSDAEAVLAHYADDAVFVSALAAKVTGDPEVRGKSALRAYWTKALASLSAPLQFALDSFLWDAQRRTIVILYISTESDRRVRRSELMQFGPDGLIHRGEGFAGADCSSGL
jgi:ketosteroid isomerase-like protein